MRMRIEGGLAGSVRAKQSEDFSLRTSSDTPRQRHAISVALVDPVEGEEVHDLVASLIADS